MFGSGKHSDVSVVARRAVISGQVQGVFFRAFVQDAARRAGVRGWAVNRDDGRVEVHVEGALDGVEHIVSLCREGPAHARVQTVDVREVPAEDLKGFEAG